MRFGASLLLIAAGAILRFAITPQQSHGVNWGTIGVILMIVGAIGAIIAAVLVTARRRTDVTYRGAAVAPAPHQADPRYATTDPRYASATYIEPGPVDPRL